MLGRSDLWRAFLVVALGLTLPAAAGELTQADLLRRMLDLDRLATPPPPGERAGLFSSFDRAAQHVEDGRYVNWDANNDAGQFLGVTPDGWDIAADAPGPGVITRVWMRSGGGQVRIVIDGQRAIENSIPALFDGSTEPFGNPLSYSAKSDGGFVLIFPLGFAKSCQIHTRGYRDAYEIDWLALPPETRVQPFSSRLDAEAEKALEEVIEALRNGLTNRQLFAGRRLSSAAAQQDLAPGDKLEWKIERPGTIRGFYVSITERVEPRELYVMHNLVLRIRFDDAAEPDVESPLTEFFGAGFNRNPARGLVMGTDLWSDLPGEFPLESWFMYCYFPMPFAKGAVIEIENRNTDRRKPIGVLLYLRIDRDAPPADALRFRARYREENPCETFDYPVLETDGRGRLVGCVLNVDCPRRDWWGQGDHKIWIDDDAFPSIAGADTDGYFASVPGLVQESRPTHGVTLAAPFGKSSLYRWHTLDAVSFQTALRFTLENWQRDELEDVYYATTVYWYGEPGRAARFDPLPPQKLGLPGLRIPGAVEIETAIRGQDWGRVRRQKFERGLVELSGEACAYIATTAPVQVEVPVEQAGKYRVRLRVHPRRSFGTVDVRDAAGDRIGVAKYAARGADTYAIGETNLKAGANTLTLTCDRPAYLDCLILERIDP